MSLAGGFKTMLDTFDQTQLSRQKLGLLRDKFEVEKVGLLTAQEEKSLELQVRKRALVEGQAIRFYDAKFPDGIEGFIANATNTQDRNRRVFEANQFVRKYSKDLQFMGPDRQINGFERLVYPDASSFEQTNPAEPWKNVRYGISITGPDGKLGIATHGKGGRSADEKVMQFDEMGVAQVTRIIDDRMREISARPSATDEERTAAIMSETRRYFNKKGNTRTHIENASITGGNATSNDNLASLIGGDDTSVDMLALEKNYSGDQSPSAEAPGNYYLDAENRAGLWLVGEGKWDGWGEMPLDELPNEMRKEVEEARKRSGNFTLNLDSFFPDNNRNGLGQMRRYRSGKQVPPPEVQNDSAAITEEKPVLEAEKGGSEPPTDTWNNKTVDIFYQAGDNNEYSWFYVKDENGDYIKNKDGEKAKFKAQTNVLLNGRAESVSRGKNFLGEDDTVKVDAIPKPGSVIYSESARQARQVAEGNETAALGTPYNIQNPPDINLYAGLGDDPRSVNDRQQGLGAYTLPPGVRVEDAMTPTDFNNSETSIVEQINGYPVNANTEVIPRTNMGGTEGSTEGMGGGVAGSGVGEGRPDSQTPSGSYFAGTQPNTPPEQTGLGSLAEGDGPYREVTASDLRAVNRVMGTGRTYADGFGRPVTVQPRATAEQIENILMTGSMGRTAEKLYEAKASQATKAIDNIKEKISVFDTMIGNILIDKYGEGKEFADKRARVAASADTALRVTLNNKIFQDLLAQDSFGGLTADIAKNFVEMTEDINAWERGDNTVPGWLKDKANIPPIAELRSWFRETVENQQTLFFATNALQLNRYGINNREYIEKIIAPTITFRDQPGKTGFNDRAHIPDLINIFSNPSLVQQLIKDPRVSGATEKEKIINLATQYLMGAN